MLDAVSAWLLAGTSSISEVEDGADAFVPGHRDTIIVKQAHFEQLLNLTSIRSIGIHERLLTMR